MNLTSNCKWNSEPLQSTSVMDADPFNNLFWIINKLTEAKKPLTRNMLIITGSVFKVRQAKLGDKIKHIILENQAVELEII